MNERIAYLSQIVDKIGSPLLLSILETAARNPGARSAESMKDDAQKLAELLSRTVMLSIDLGKMIEIEKSSPEHTESLRVAMAGLASPIVGRQYEQLRRPPAEADLKKVSGALEAVLAFADNFSPSPENAIRLNLLNATGTPADAHQVTIQYLQAFVPIAGAIAVFPFGQPERKMIQDTAERINQRASEMVGYVFGDTISTDQRKLTELAFVKSLAEFYSSCHEREMERFTAGGKTDAAAQQRAIAGIWTDFEARASMLETLAASLTPDHAGRVRVAVSQADPVLEQVSPDPHTPEQLSAEPVVAEQPIEYQPALEATPTLPHPVPSAIEIEEVVDWPSAEAADSPVSYEPVPQESVSAQSPVQTVQSAANPMAMFAKPRHDDAPPVPLAPTIPEAPATQQDQASYQQPSSPEQPAAQQPPAAASNPMAFFKAPPKDAQGE